MSMAPEISGVEIKREAIWITREGWRPLLSSRTWIAVVLWVGLTDFAIYRGGGWTGFAATLAFVPFLMGIVPRMNPICRQGAIIFISLLAVIALKLVWCGTEEALSIGTILSLGVMLACQGRMPYVSRIVSGPFRIVIGSIVAFLDTLLALPVLDLQQGRKPAISSQAIAGIFLPVLAMFLFSGVFILANPNFRIAFDSSFRWLSRTVELWLMELDFGEIAFWICSAVLGIGIAFPYLIDLKQRVISQLVPPIIADKGSNVFLYPAARNTLWMVNLLFAAYLTYEFAAMWFRPFPKGFYYGGYAHEGAFWLTVALAMATVTLSLVFSIRMLHDPRTQSLRKLAWIWSFENVLLAMAAFNRLFIYIDFNGLTRMRVIGLLGVATVLVGFALVVYKIAKQRDFGWLIQRQLWALGLAVVVYAALPVDSIVHRFNAREIMAGRPEASVQIIMHPMHADGMLPLLSVIDCEDVIIRDGVRAMAAKWWLQLNEKELKSQDWTRLQISEVLLKAELKKIEEKISIYTNRVEQDATLLHFREYAYQWY